MFFAAFLLMTILTKVSPTITTEHDYYKHYDEYDDYEYDDATPDQTDKPTNDTTYISEATSKKDANEKARVTTKEKTITDRLLEDVTNTNFDGEETNILTEKPDYKTPGYEVTEIIDDIPNPVTFKPIVTNFTIKLPLNNATAVNNIESNEDNKGNVPRKHSINIFHINAEFDDDKDKKPVVQNINIHKIPFGIFKPDKIRDDVLNYVHSTEVYNDLNEDHYFPNILSAPRHFLRKLKEKGSALYHKFF